jgi:hypothetical protein
MSINIIDTIKATISLDITKAVRESAELHGITDPDLLAQELLVRLGVTERTSAPPKAPAKAPKAPAKAPKAPKAPVPPPADAEGDEGSVGSKDKKDRKRTVSAKQKKDFMAIEGATEENLKSIIKGYKDASQETIDGLMTADSKENAFILFAKSVLNAPVAPAPEPEPEVKEKKTKTKAKAKKEASRVKFNATELKIFKKIVESAGSTVTDELKQEFVDYVTPMTAEQFAVVALEGHMRAFVDTKKAANGGAGKAPVAEQVLSWNLTEAAGDDDEYLVQFTHNEEELRMGEKSGKIYRTTAEAGDVQVGVVGQGEFKDVKQVVA